MLKYHNQENKMLVFSEDSGSHSVTLTLQVSEHEQTVDISELLRYFEGQRSDYDFRIFDPQFNAYVPLSADAVLPAKFFLSPIVLLKYRQPALLDESSPPERRERNQERSIRQVIGAVKLWRSYRGQGGSKPKIKMHEAARLVGVSKKSLDDYFGQLRLAVLFGFNFQKNLDKRFGILRAFVKKHKAQAVRPQDNHNLRYPTQLPLTDKQPIVASLSFNKKRNEQPEGVVDSPGKLNQPTETPMQPTFGMPAVQQPSILSQQISGAIPEQAEIQNQFYQCYELLLTQPKDPFVHFNAREYREYRNWNQDYQLEPMPW